MHPMMRTSEQGKTAINRLCMHLAKVTKNDAFIDQVHAEWLMYMLEGDKRVDEWVLDHPEEGNDICGYWSYVLQLGDGIGAKKYEKLGVVLASINSVSW